MQDNEKQKGGISKMFMALMFLSVLVMTVAVSMIYEYTRQRPEILQNNAQSTAVSENVGYVNTQSPQMLENDASNIRVTPLQTSPVFLVGIGVFMLIMVISFIFVKVVEYKEEN